MKAPIIFLLALLSFSLSCSSSANRTMSTEGVTAKKDSAPASQQIVDQIAKTSGYDATAQKVSLTDVDKAGSIADAADRKIIRNADITIEVPSTTDAQHA
jgi:light-regulated signal transduction histidine kinase (bacteriophytochrome)